MGWALDAELLAVLLRNGTKNKSSIELANTILNAHFLHKGLLGIPFLTREELICISGIGDTKATLILAFSELSKRLNTGRLKSSISFHNPASIAHYYMEKCKYLKRERTYVMFFSTAHTLIKEMVLTEGTINISLFSPRELMIEALRCEAVNFILIHNHPSGVPEPSEADKLATKKIFEAGQIMDIHLSDHIIVGNGCYVSMLERGYIQ